MKGHLKYWLFALIAVFIYVILSSLTFGCPFRFIAGLSCPGCGMSRSFFSLLHGDIKGAAAYHPLIFIVPVLFYAIYRCDTKNDKIGKGLLAAIIFLFFAVWIVRLFLGDPIVAFDFGNSFLFRMREGLFGIL